MEMCPNFNTKEWKYLESQLGELEAYKYFSRMNGDLSNVKIDESRESMLNRVKELGKDVKGIYQSLLQKNPQEALREIAHQLYGTETEHNEAIRIFGPELSRIAMELFDKGDFIIRDPNENFKIDPTDYNPEDRDQRLYKVKQSTRAAEDKEPIETSSEDGISNIHFDSKIYNNIIKTIDKEDIKVYRNFLLDNLYTRKSNPVTTELLHNAASLAKDLGRQDMVDIARLIYKNLKKNPNLNVQIVEKMSDVSRRSNTKASYNHSANIITFAHDTIGTGSLEIEVDTVLHEFLHSLTFKPFVYEGYSRMGKNDKEFLHSVNIYYNYFKGLKKANPNIYAFSNAMEFLNASLLDKNFQNYLKSIIPEKNFFDYLKDIFRSILRLFGVKEDEKNIEAVNPEDLQKDLFNSLYKYLQNLRPMYKLGSIKEQGRDYGLSFKLVAEQDYEEESRRLKEEKQSMKQSLSDDLRSQLKKGIEKSILSIKSFGSSIRNKIPESQEGFKAIFRQLAKLEDPSYNLDQVDYFFDFTGEIQAIMNVANNKISKLQTDQTITDQDFKLGEYESIMSAIRNFDPILNEIQNIKIQLQELGYNVSLNSLNDLALKRARIESIYSMGVFPIVTSKFVDILSPASKKAIQISNDKIDELDKRILVAEKADNKSRINQLKKEKQNEQRLIDREFNLNSEKVQQWLRGEMGDSNILSVWMQAGVSNRNPVVSGLAKFLRDNVGEAAPRVLELMNSMQDSLETYSKATGRSFSNISEFNSPLIQTRKHIVGKDDKGQYTYDDRYSLLHEFNGNHIVELQKFKRDISDLSAQKREIENSPEVDQEKLEDIIKKIKEKQTARRQFISDYMEQKYAPEVHKALDMLHEDLGGYTIWDYMGPLIARIDDTEEAIDQETDEGRLKDLYDQLDDYNLELSRLGSLYEKSPESREKKVAEKLKERRELLKKYSNFVLTEKGQIQFDTEFARQKRKLQTGDITPEKYERWLEDNTITELTPEYWDRKRDILKRLNDVLTKLGARTNKDETVGKLYRDMEEITQPHRDSNGIINGREMTDKELKDAKSVEQQIEDVKNKLEGITGLSKLERAELSSLTEQINELNSAIYFEPNADRKADLQSSKEILEEKARKISAKQKKLDKELIKEYQDIIKELMELDDASITKYYFDESEERKAQEIAKVDVSNMPSKFINQGRTYQKSGNDWLEITGGGIQKRDTSFVQNVYREQIGEVNFRSSDWYRDNHITKLKWLSNIAYDPSDFTSRRGEWQNVEEPTYAWKQTRPNNSKYIKEGQPSIKYKTRQIKDQYVNKNYREDINGDLRPKLKGAKDDRFINKDYYNLVNSNNSADQATASMLKFLTDTYFEAQQSIPKGMRPGYELPSIRKSDTERLTGQTLKQSSQDFFEYLGQVAQAVKDKTLKNEQDKDILYGYNDDLNGIVPVKFLSDMDSKDISIDLPKSILTFASEMVKRQQLIKALPFATAVRDIVNSPAYRPVKTKDGVIQSIKKKFLPRNTEAAVRSSSSNTALQINEIIKSEIYGEQMKDQPAAKLINGALGIGAKIMLGVNFSSSIQNYANAFTQSIMETESKNKNFSMQDFFKAQKIYYGRMDELMSDLGKYGNKSFLNQFFDYFGGINYKIFSKNHRTLAYGKASEFAQSLGVPNQITEHMLNYHMAIAIALHYRVADGKGNMIPILDAFTLRDRKLVQKEGFNISEVDRKEMISRLNSSSRRVNGEYGDRILLDKYVLGKMVTFMNRYLIPFVTKRYGSRGFNIQDGVRDEGYWRLLGKLMIKDFKAKSVPIVGGWKYYTNSEKEAIVKASTELGFTVMFYLMTQALGGDDPKKIKDNSVIANNILYTLNGIQQQNEAFMPIPGVGFDDFLRKIQNPFPILGKVKNLVSLMNDGAKTSWYEMGLPGASEHDVKYMRKVGWHKPGDFKIFADLQKLIGIKRIENYLYPNEAIKAQESISRIK